MSDLPAGYTLIPDDDDNTAPAPQAPAPQAPARRPYTTPSGVSIVGPSPTQLADAQNSPAQYQKEYDAADASRQRAANLSNMAADAAMFTPGQGQFERLRQAGQRWMPEWMPFLGGGDTSALAAQERFDKLVAQTVNQQQAATDAKMNLLIQATPTSTKSPEGVRTILQQLQGNEDYMQARAAFARQSNQGSYRSFQADVGKLNPQVFQLNRMTQPGERKQFMDALKKRDPQGWQKLTNDINWAADRGLIPGVGGTSSPTPAPVAPAPPAAAPTPTPASAPDVVPH